MTCERLGLTTTGVIVLLAGIQLTIMALSSLLGTIIVSFLHNLVPILLVSITDAVAGIVMGIIALLWAVWFFIRSIPAIIKVLMVWRSS